MLKGKISLWNRSGIFSSMLALLLCIAMCFECVPFYTVAAEETEETGTYKTKAISWLVGEKDDVSGWGDTDLINDTANALDRKSTRLNSSHYQQSRMPSSA